MKKLFALILALVMMTSLSVTAFAANPDYTLNNVGNQSITVMGKYVLGDVDTTYSVNIDWDDFVFTYTAEAKWDAEHYENVDAGEGGEWSGAGTITVTNNSNVAVNVGMAFVGTVPADNNQIKEQPTGDIKVGDAPYTTREVAKNGGTVAAILTIADGQLKPLTEGEVAIGTITVSISVD